MELVAPQPDGDDGQREQERVNTGLTPSTATLTMVAPAKTRARAIRGTQLSTVTQRDLVAVVVVSESVMHAPPVLWGLVM